MFLALHIHIKVILAIPTRKPWFWKEELMKKKLVAVLGAAMLLLSLAAGSVSQAQTGTVTKVQAVQNPDGTYTIVEYPFGKMSVVSMNPVRATGATCTATRR